MGDQQAVREQANESSFVPFMLCGVREPIPIEKQSNWTIVSKAPGDLVPRYAPCREPLRDGECPRHGVRTFSFREVFEAYRAGWHRGIEAARHAEELAQRLKERTDA